MEIWNKYQKLYQKNSKQILTDFISLQKSAYVKNKQIGESGRLISDAVEIAKRKMLKVFQSLGTLKKHLHSLLIFTPEKYGFGKNIALCVKTVLRDSRGVVCY